MVRTGDEEKEYIPRRQRPEAESGLIVLLLLSELPGASDTFLLRCCSEAQLLTYFELMPALARLTREGQAARQTEGTSYCYRLTEAGAETLALFAARIPGSDRDRAAALLPAWREALRKAREFTSSMRQTEDGEYEVRLSVIENGTAILTIAAPVPSSELAARMTARWEKEGAEVYREIIGLMAGGEDA